MSIEPGRDEQEEVPDWSDSIVFQTQHYYPSLLALLGPLISRQIHNTDHNKQLNNNMLNIRNNLVRYLFGISSDSHVKICTIIQ